MDPATGLVIAVIAAAYLAGGFDRHTLRATRGAASFVKAGARGAYRHRKAERAKTAAQRAKDRKARHARLWKSGGWGKAAVIAEKGAWHAGRLTANATRHAWAGIREGAASYQPAADAAWQQRQQKRAARKARKAARREAADRLSRMGDQTPPAATAAGDTATKENPMADAPAVPVTELATLDDFLAELGVMRDIVEQAHTAIDTWASNIAERYAAADWGALPITQVIVALEDANPGRAIAAFGDLVDAAHRATSQVKTTVGEAADAAQATGDIKAYASQ